jgi:hypothetical protein
MKTKLSAAGFGLSFGLLICAASTATSATTSAKTPLGAIGAFNDAVNAGDAKAVAAS